MIPMCLWDLRCAPLQSYRDMLSTIDLHCAPLTCVMHHGAQGGPTCLRSRVTPNIFCACSMWTTKNWKMLGVTPTSHGLWSLCAPSCTVQVGGAQCMLVVHNVVLYCWGGAQRSSDKQRDIHTQIPHGGNLLIFVCGCAARKISTIPALF